MDKIINLLRYDPTQPLMFNTGLFLLLFGAFMLLFWLVKGVRVLKMTVVILFSLFFYYKSSGLCCLILLGVCLSDYLLGLLMESADRRNSGAAKRLIVAVNVLVNVGMLAYFKYFHLILDTLSRFVNMEGSFESLILPAGISFFT
ncbi:MAG: MBOAT family protein, partial [Duncaniella sp.]|nr:MBOAT family protein [Duncaniella sp.]